MKEEGKKSVTKLKFKRLMRKKWLYPALYLSVAALVLVGVFWYQQGTNDLEDQIAEKPDSQVQDEFLTDNEKDAVPVMDHQENLEMPVADEQTASIVTKFYDYDASEKDQESALVLYNNKYYQSEGVDITREDGEAFEVTAALSGQVTEVKEDPLYGNVIEVSHDENITTVYASLEDVEVKAGSDIAQGDVLGSAGRNSFGQASGVHVHFEVRNDGQPVNPEEFFGQPMSKIIEKDGEEAPAEEPQEEAEQPQEGTEPQEDAEQPQEGTEPQEDAEQPQEGDEPQEDAEQPQEGVEPQEDGEQPSEDEELNMDEDPTGSEDEEQTPGEESGSSISNTQA
ncbi:stage II sporulation protein Q [Halobacillus karajensis]|uniref:Stage II sporulation protein Q n=1 Tax=Halobacillus karajensis TaxID=195088 RepID=A0A024P3T9_9BACI|nr:M23 family metallopeptidase [Halobacillus karajensis]CDQ18844.1 Stage II sporulation protein Q [Halobacillus karajensis]CDQ23083.1 Stage II sporulation protein Q [Halobacillus karajensis]CDQ26565.1 Stage II sporulation protein Q [Halobacillus karajensis]SEH45323.1 stage II sporulation protein Q [Halobacillus karajensis]